MTNSSAYYAASVDALVAATGVPSVLSDDPERLYKGEEQS